MKLSIVVPAYRQEATIHEDIQNLRQVLAGLGMDYEIIVVVDGHVDGTHEAALPLQRDGVVVLSYPKNQGKGHAVRHGMRAATGEIVGFIDAGGDLDPRDLVTAVRHLVEQDADVVIGSKRHRQSVVQYPALRRCYSFAYQIVVWILFGFNVRDTQAGLKVFRREVVDQALPLLAIKRFAFDVEFLAIVRMLGYRKILESPIRVKLVFPSSVGGARTVMTMLWDTAVIFYRLRILRHYQRRHVTSEAISPSSQSA